MILTRLGNKKKLSEKLLENFPEEVNLFIDLFFGSGSVTYKMVNRVPHIIANDLDSDVYNLFIVVQEQKEELREAIEKMPIHEDLFKHWVKNKEHDRIKKAIRFLMLSNFSLYGTQTNLRLGICNTKRLILDRLDDTFKLLAHVKFMNTDFRSCFKKISIRKGQNLNRVFIYADPPYLDTCNTYESGGFNKKDSEDLFEMLVSSKMLFAVSEFDHPTIIDLAKHHKLNVIDMGERQNIKNRRTEILIKNF